MTNQEIFDLMARLERSSICRLRVQQGDFSLELDKGAALSPASNLQPAAPAPAVAAAVPAEAESPVIRAPLAGVFYTTPAPGEEPFIHVGEHFTKGQTLCLMEAMKMISEVPAPCDGILTDIRKENGVLAAFDEPLFGYRPC